MDQQRELSEHQELRELLIEVQKTQDLILHRLDLLEERLAPRADTAPGPFRRK